MSARTFARTVAAARRVRGRRPRRSRSAGSAADEPKSRAEAAAPKRKPWTTSKVAGSPEPPPKFKSVRVFPDVKFNHPLLIARCPGTDRLFVGEQDGMLYSLANKPDAKTELFFDLRKEIKTLDQLPGREGRRRTLRPRVPPEVRGEPLLLRLLHAAARRTPKGDRSRTARGCRGSR